MTRVVLAKPRGLIQRVRAIRAGWSQSCADARPSAVLVCVAYYLGGQIDHLLGSNVSPAILWPPNAMLLAALLLAPMRSWWIYALAVLPADRAISWGIPLHYGVGLYAGNTLQSILAALLVRWSIGVGLPWYRFRSTLSFILLAAVVAPMAGAFVGAAAIHGFDPALSYWTAWRGWFCANAVTNLTFVPALSIAMARASGAHKARWPSGVRAFEAEVLFCVLIAIAIAVFEGRHGEAVAGTVPALLYAPLPLLLWAAVRFGAGGVSVAQAIVALLAIHGAIHGRGPFAPHPQATGVLQLQLFLFAVASPLWCLAATVHEERIVLTALEISERRFRAMFDESTIAIALVDSTGRPFQSNRALQAMLGFSAEELRQMPCSAFTHPDDHRAEWPLFQEAFAGKRSHYQIEKRYLRKDGRQVWVRLVVSIVRDTTDAPLFAVGMAQDITAARQAEADLRTTMDEMHVLKDRLLAENVYLREEVTGERDAGADHGQIIGTSDALRRALAQARQVAPTDATILILGETGTGKEQFARAIHAMSARREHPLVTLNCAALSSSLIESELFGHERGAFTGASSRRVGRFELADGGTLFLDEIGELPADLQAKLLRVLEEGEFERVGSSKTHKVNVRIIAATNRDLVAGVRQKRFRADLYYRLNVHSLVLPPLRERREDIPLLAMEFATRAARRIGRTIDVIPPAVLATLRRYHWPGNVREIQNVIERAVLASPGPDLRLAEQLDDVASKAPGSASEADSRAVPDLPVIGRASLEDFERWYIRRVLEQTRWRISGPQGAAVILGLNPSTLRFRMEKLGISRAHEPIG